MAASPVIRQNGTIHHFTGCSGIGQYEVLQKLGEGTFGYGSPTGVQLATNKDYSEVLIHILCQ